MPHLATLLRDASGTTRAVLAAAAFAVIGLGALMPLVATPRAEPREIVLVARDMAFYLEGSDTPNPTLTLAPGEEVRVVVRNQDPGFAHDFAVRSLGASIEPLAGGASGTLRLRAPASPGRHEYVCRPHAQMMRGIIDVAK
jgi:plastocyanin